MQCNQSIFECDKCWGVLPLCLFVAALTLFDSLGSVLLYLRVVNSTWIFLVVDSLLLLLLWNSFLFWGEAPTGMLSVLPCHLAQHCTTSLILVMCRHTSKRRFWCSAHHARTPSTSCFDLALGDPCHSELIQLCRTTMQCLSIVQDCHLNTTPNRSPEWQMFRDKPSS